ncbi:MAG: pyrimidine dimer DNA glycosylase/endonuclease V [bacterium]
MWIHHQDLIPCLSSRDLQYLHRDCCNLRGAGWKLDNSHTNYIREYPREHLIAYHMLVLEEMESKDMNYNYLWYDHLYRGTSRVRLPNNNAFRERVEQLKLNVYRGDKIFKEHNEEYLKKSLKRLDDKEKVCYYYDILRKKEKDIL